MKTIEIKTGEQTAQFTTKSVTFDGKEFFYSKMQNVKHNPSGCIYAFTYDGELKMLPYEAKDAKVLAAIFSQVQKLPPHKQAAADAPAAPGQKAAAAPAPEVPAERNDETAPQQSPAAPAQRQLRLQV